MHKQVKNLIFVLSLVIVSGLAIASLAQKATKTKATKKTAKPAAVTAKFLAKGDGIEFCAVSGEKLESKDIHGEFFARTVYFCCENCLAKAQKNPELYVKKTEAEQIEATKGLAAKAEQHDHHAKEATKTEVGFLGKGDGVESCPVTGEPISKDVKIEVQGKTVYACCAGCLDKVKEHPELYLKWATK